MTTYILQSSEVVRNSDPGGGYVRLGASEHLNASIVRARAFARSVDSHWTPTLPVPVEERLIRVDGLAGVDIPIATF